MNLLKLSHGNGVFFDSLVRRALTHSTRIRGLSTVPHNIPVYPADSQIHV